MPPQSTQASPLSETLQGLGAQQTLRGPSPMLIRAPISVKGAGCRGVSPLPSG
eukprot:CAMPEP_0171221846 /NCGR_PEP_ID=MMETSP0790-20130122/34964_1 /TAXON_ID=2925 /ORGANISM="Alexandrium catenella, Strain OF101" /LENGTH=52 /DNA_ID=CAMNT_0011687785 /DNA_START=97 /DNA_END=251 /DNA_ORIENTATION=-